MHNNKPFHRRSGERGQTIILVAVSLGIAAGYGGVGY